MPVSLSPMKKPLRLKRFAKFLLRRLNGDRPPVDEPTTGPQCPICGSRRFGDFRNRVGVRCVGCGSFERSRLLWMVLNQIDLTPGNRPFFHVAPEIGIARRLHERLGSSYRAFDFSPEIYERVGLPVARLDLCQDLHELTADSIGGMCHVHVLEHVRCDAKAVLRQINRVIAPGGYHVFGVPFWGHRYREDMSPTLTDADRLSRFGHEDHVRAFGARDFMEHFGDAFEGMEPVPLPGLVDPGTAIHANVPQRALAPLNTHHIFVYRKLTG